MGAVRQRGRRPCSSRGRSPGRQRPVRAARRPVPAVRRRDRARRAASAAWRPDACSRRSAEVAQTAQHITDTEDLTSRIQYHADDEVGQLATRFNAMIERLQRSRAALDESVRAQRQLVADASHELRTPITSLRTNIEVLMAGDALSRRRPPPAAGRRARAERGAERADRRRDRACPRRPADHLGRGRPARPRRRRVRSRARAATSPRSGSRARSSRWSSTGVPERLARAINNLLDNAAHHSAAGGVVEVIVDHRGVRVRDHGTGIDPADLPYVFDRFFRGANSRHRQGSGLGLAIVRQVAAPARRLRGGGQRPRRRRGVHAAAADRRRGSARSRRRAVPGRRRSAPAQVAAVGRCWPLLAGLAIRAWRAIRKRLRRNQAHVANTAATGTSSSTRTAGVPDRQRDHELDRHRRDRREQDRVRAVAREMLARRSPRVTPNRQMTTPPISAGPP